MTIRTLKWTATVVALACAAVLGAAQAQTAAAPTTQPLPRELGKPDSDWQMDIRAFQVDGLPAASAETLARLTAPYTGTARGYGDLMDAATTVTRYMQRELGYYVGYAYVPEQRPQDGVVRLQALEGRLDRIDIVVPEGPEGEALRERIARQLAGLQPGSVLRADELDRAVLLLEDLRGVNVKVEIQPGRQPGTAALRVTPVAESATAWRLDADTYGNRYTGLARVTGAVSRSGVLRVGDAVSAQLLSSHTGGLRQATLGYVTPVGTGGWRVGALLSRVEYGVDTDDFPADYHGSVNVAGGYALYPLLRQRNVNLFGLFSYEHKHFDDRQVAGSLRKFSNDWVLGLVGDSRDAWGGGGINTFELQGLVGRMHFGAGANSLGLDEHFSKWTLGAARLQNLIPGRLQLYGRYKGQLSSTSLDATERYAVGGPNGVRGFDPGQGSADTAHVLSAELRWLPPERLFGAVSRELVFTVFQDWARVRYFHDSDLQTVGVDNTATLGSTGLGVTWERPADLHLHVNLAWRTLGDDQADPDDADPRVNLLLSKRF